MFTDLDIEALVILRSMMDLGVADVETSLQLARVIGSSMARIAEAEVSPPVRGLAIAGGTGSTDTVEAADRFAALADQSLPAMARLLEFVWRRHVQAAVRRAMLLRSRQRQRRPARSWPWASPTWSASPCSASSCPRRSWPRWWAGSRRSPTTP